MKKLLTGIAMMTLVFSIGSIDASAASNAKAKKAAVTTNICDYCGASCEFVDADGDGICDNYISGKSGRGRFYVDADGDGVCDNAANGSCPRNGKGRGRGRGRCGGRRYR